VKKNKEKEEKEEKRDDIKIYGKCPHCGGDVGTTVEEVYPEGTPKSLIEKKLIKPEKRDTDLHCFGCSTMFNMQKFIEIQESRKRR
jgi:hypothetical protein